MTIHARLRNPEGYTRLGIESLFATWNGIKTNKIHDVIVEQRIISFADDEHSISLEIDPNPPPIHLQEVNKGDVVDKFDLTNTSVNRVEISVGTTVTSKSGEIIFERTQ
ncbi:hypothetical protein A3A79_01610 [Candidatus Gottesmanbacteria bacterium RIFCSPLOWO2_01_FULL_43_11b]|uniref:Uncharacterized protein n=1 Tax=Candidatus Gottesmanbacteria bacterium RIFCSPLOWO2_01_FULL_43_11b TaxID=1798392 RepID=A0A1F6AGJ5_9BACT|nr:MAG: hypothetical protein A3A79_01610 [Candidatus Gottesmanbacteria bacterium RIFCSPLOWO2_01_FULL_43_11b]